MSKRLLAAAATIFMLGLAGAVPALATAPIRVPAGPINATFPAGTVCPFELTTTTLVNNETVTAFFDQDGTLVREEITGRLVQQFTNDETSKTITEQVSGPATILFNGDGSATIIGRGTGFLILGPTDSPSSSLLLLTGLTVFTISPTGVQTLVSTTGPTQDICALLA